MIKYLVLLAIISIMVTMACRYFRQHLPVDVRVVYITIGASFFFTAFFPVALASFKMPVALLVYGVVLLMLSFGLSRLQERLSYGEPAAEGSFYRLLSAGLAGGEADPEGPEMAAVPEKPGRKEYRRSLPEDVFHGIRQAAGETAAAEDHREPVVSADPAEEPTVEEFPGPAGAEPENVILPGIDPPGAEGPGTKEIPAAAAPPAASPPLAPPPVVAESGEAEKPPVPAVYAGGPGLPAPISAGGTVPEGREPDRYLPVETASAGEDGEARPFTLEGLSEPPATGEGLIAPAGDPEPVAEGSPVKDAVGSGDRPAVDGEQESGGAVLPAGSEGGGAGEAAGSETPVSEDAEEQVGSEVTSTVDSYIARGFAAREKGNYVEAVDCFLKALLSGPGEQLKALLALEISAVYQQLGQYRQAVMLLETMLAPGSGIRDRALRQQIYARKIYLEMIAELLKTARQPNTPYAAIPSLIKVKAGVETAERLKLKRKGERAFEKHEGDYQFAGFKR